MTNRREFIMKTGLASSALALPGVLSSAAAMTNEQKNNATGEKSNVIAAAKSPLIKLNNGITMPQLGVGSFALPTIQAADDIKFALQNGYRLVDTATNYSNEKEVGQGIAQSGVPRSELFITTKLWIEDFGYDQALKGFDRSLQALGLEYLDLYLLHWPVPSDFEKTVSAYKALEQLYADKRIRAIGVSNFNPEHLQKLIDRSKIVPAVNQIELHPYLDQKAASAANEKYGIKTECWSPIGGSLAMGMRNPTKATRVLEDYVIVKLAEKYKKFTSQIVLRWHTQHGRIVIPKSQHYERLLANINIFDFELNADDMAAMDNLNQNLRGGPDPLAFNVDAFKALVAKRDSKVQQ